MDATGKLASSVPLGEIVTARPEVRLDSLSRQPAVTVLAQATREEIVAALEGKRIAALPVVDGAGRLIGVIRHSALVSTSEAVATAGIQTMVGAGRDEGGLSPVGYAVRQRLPWLQINLATAFLAAFIVGLFEGTIAQFTALAVLLPVVAGQSGNSGMQALAVTLRALALREIDLRQWPRLIVKEAGVGILNGLAVAVVTMAAVFLWSRSPGLTAVIGIAMVTAMVIAGIAGALIPVALKGLRQDPAQSSSIVLTTVTDVMGFLTFLGLATLFARFL
jgi:magnesium transporter